MILVAILYFLGVQASMWEIIVQTAYFHAVINLQATWFAFSRSSVMLAALAQLLFQLSKWLFSFKYWQTTYELKFLFVRENTETKQKRQRFQAIFNLMVCCLNIVFVTTDYFMIVNYTSNGLLIVNVVNQSLALF